MVSYQSWLTRRLEVRQPGRAGAGKQPLGGVAWLINQPFWFRVDGWICWGDPPWWWLIIVVINRINQQNWDARIDAYWVCPNQVKPRENHQQPVMFEWVNTPAISSRVGSGLWCDIPHDPPVAGPSTSRMLHRPIQFAPSVISEWTLHLPPSEMRRQVTSSLTMEIS